MRIALFFAVFTVMLFYGFHRVRNSRGLHGFVNVVNADQICPAQYTCGVIRDGSRHPFIRWGIAAGYADDAFA